MYSKSIRHSDHRPGYFTSLYCTTYDVRQVGNIDGAIGEIHDRSLVRAGKSSHTLKAVEGSSQLTRDPKRTLFISGFDESIDEKAIRTACGIYGDIVLVRIVRDIGKTRISLASDLYIVVTCYEHINQVTGRSRGYAFVEFRSQAECSRAYKVCRLSPSYPSCTISERYSHNPGDPVSKYVGQTRFNNGRKVVIDFERGRVMQGWKPRRLGGGLGGNIKSGQVRFGGRLKPFKRTGASRRYDAFF